MFGGIRGISRVITAENIIWRQMNMSDWVSNCSKEHVGCFCAIGLLYNLSSFCAQSEGRSKRTN